MSVERIAVATGPHPVETAMEERGYRNVRLDTMTLRCTAPDGSPRSLSIGHSLEEWQLSRYVLEGGFILTIDHRRLRADAVEPPARTR